MNTLIKSLFVTIVIVGAVGSQIYLFNKNYKIHAENEKLRNEIKELKYDNVNLKQAISRKDAMLRNYEKKNRELAMQVRNNKNKNNVKIKKDQERTTTYSKKSNIVLQSKENKKIQRSYARYEKYSSNMHLVSDSKIKIDKYNKLYSNAPIYGRYKTSNYHMYKIYNVKCDSKKNKYNVTDECSAKTIDGDTIYITKMRVNDLRQYNTNTHMIECKYNKKHGVMNDCSLKMKS
jgi:predicted RNase H-like nuclease (RuvC/YqgF family)